MVSKITWRIISIISFLSIFTGPFLIWGILGTSPLAFTCIFTGCGFFGMYIYSFMTLSLIGLIVFIFSLKKLKDIKKTSQNSLQQISQ